MITEPKVDSREDTACRPASEHAPITTVEELESMMQAHPTLCYEGWKSPYHSDEQFQQLREELKRATVAIDLCRRVFRDPRFLKRLHGRHTAYHLKHVVERWELDLPQRCSPSVSGRYNGVYVCQGVAAAAAILEGFRVRRPRGSKGPGCIITVPRHHPKLGPVATVDNPR